MSVLHQRVADLYNERRHGERSPRTISHCRKRQPHIEYDSADG